MFNATAHIAVLDRGVMSDALLERLEQTDGLDVKLYTEQEITDALDRSAIVYAAIIPTDFTASLLEGKTTEITFRRRGPGGDEGQIVAGIIRDAAQDIARGSSVKALVGDMVRESNVSDSTLNRVVDEAIRIEAENPSVVVRTESIGAQGDTFTVTRVIPGILVMILLLTVSLSAQTLVQERENGTLERLLTTQLTSNQLFLGKFLAGTARATLQAAILVILAFIVLRPAGLEALAQTLLLTLLLGASVTVIGLVISALARTTDQATWAAVSLTMFMTVFGGTFFELVPGSVLEMLSRFTLNRYAIDALGAVLDGTGNLSDQGMEIMIMGGVAIVGLVAARLLFRSAGGGR